MYVDANTAWFTFTTLSGNFAVRSFTGDEGVNTPYNFTINLVSRSPGENTTALLGTEATLTFRDKSGGVRHVHGLVSKIQQGATGNAFTHYSCSLVPRLWYLEQIVDHRIFQHLSVVEIINTILAEQGFTDVAFKLFYEYEPREYCVQYGETGLEFITRLTEEEGIYYYFKHDEDKHTLCFCDREGGPAIPGESDLRFFPGSGQRPDTAVISKICLQHAVNSNAVSYREWNFTTPKLFLGVGEHEPNHENTPVPKGMLLEQYQYPHQYDLTKPGERYANLNLLRQLAFRRSIECESDVARFLPSYTFTVNSHPRNDVNEGWWVTSVRHEAEQPGVLEHEAPENDVLSYKSTVTAIPEMTRYIPSLDHPRPVIDGAQTAVVTGPEGEEIYTDKHGRVKVQFFWDRADQWNEKSSCWIRVSQAWAGSLYGTVTIPRVGHEVIVNFLEGSPDRPIITGRVCHELNQPPYALPEHKTRSGFKSMSTPGDGENERGHNCLWIEDKKGEEEIYVHAEKDVNLHVKNDWKEHVLHDKHRTVDNFTYLEIEGETHEKLHGQRKTELFANDNLTVHGDRHFASDGKWLAKAGDEIHLKAGSKVVLEAGVDLTIKAGGQWIRLDPSGIKTSPQFFIGAGSPGSGSGANPESPEESIETDAGTKPSMAAKISMLKASLLHAQNTAQPICEICS